MNLLHRAVCGSPYWKRTVHDGILPWVLEDLELGDRVLEVGPGPGAATEVLRALACHVTCIEIDRGLAARLANRMTGRNVTVLCGDATSISFSARAFDGAVSLTMLHHVPAPALQDRLLAEVARVLRPGATFAGFDVISTRFSRVLHAFDTFVAIDPSSFAARLAAAGFTDVAIDVRSIGFRFRATRAG